MKSIYTLLILIACSGIKTSAQTGLLVPVRTDHSELIFRVGEDGRLYQAYFGARLSTMSDSALIRSSEHLAYVTSGTDNLFSPAIRITHNDGNPSLELKYVSNQVEKQGEDIIVTHIRLKDPQYPVEVILHFKAFAKENVLEQWTEIIHHEAKPVTLFNYASSMLHFDASHYWLTQFHGDWAEEMKMQENELSSGIRIIDTKLGTRAHR
jgi:alpha-galactosidase